MLCPKCTELSCRIVDESPVDGPGSYPSTLELAYLVNLEYYIDPKFNYIHEIPEDNGDDQQQAAKVTEMVKFLYDRRWQLVTSTSYEGFSSSSFINRLAKQLVIVHRGTENWEQMKTDAMLAVNMLTPKAIETADRFTTEALIKNTYSRNPHSGEFLQNAGASLFSVTITGHSLGGWLAQISSLISRYPKFHPTGNRGVWTFPNGQTLDLNQPRKPPLHCVSFDSPGATFVLGKLGTMANTSAWKEKRWRDLEDPILNIDNTIFLANRNPVNMCGQHIGRVIRIDVMSDCWWWQQWTDPLASHSMRRILKYFIDNEDTDLAARG